MLNRLSEAIRLPSGTQVAFTAEDAQGGALAPGVDRYLTEARLEGGLPVWRYTIDGHLIEKRVVLVHLQNTVHVAYTLLEGGGPVRLRVRPYVCFRPLRVRIDPGDARRPPFARARASGLQGSVLRRPART